MTDLTAEKKEVTRIIAELKAAGADPREVSLDGGTVSVAGLSVEDIVEELYAGDEAHLRVVLLSGARHTVFFVFGNEPHEVICDYSSTEEFDVIIDSILAHWDEGFSDVDN